MDKPKELEGVFYLEYGIKSLAFLVILVHKILKSKISYLKVFQITLLICKESSSA